jgi:DNA (cytosine-5)-methyltransferase 1
MISPHELLVDSFAGGGGASTGIYLATGRQVDIAINHDPDAIAMHRVNHPATEHFTESVWDVDPVTVCCGRPVGLFHLSPDCKHFSKAKGGKPVSKKIRGLAWVLFNWVNKLRRLHGCGPRIITLENVEEFQTWGPLDKTGKLIKKLSGWFFRCFVGGLRRRGYQVEWREIRACDHGAPTIRKRLYLVARNDGLPIVWPQATHGPGLIPHRTAAECIDWKIPAPSIFTRKRPLAEKTLRRVAKGIRRYVLDCPNPFQVPEGCVPFLTEFANASTQRTMPANEPLRTICAEVKGGHHALVTAFLAKHYGGVVGSDIRKPLGTVTTKDHHSLVTAFFVKYYGNERDGIGCTEPLHTITTKDRFGLVMIKGEAHHIADIGLRMLTPRELYLAQGFPEGYVIDWGWYENPKTGFLYRKKFTTTKQVRMVGNSVSPLVEAALVRSLLNAHPQRIAV